MSLIYGGSSNFQKLIERTDYYARTPWPVLILGETGVGKELLARRLHERSNRSSSLFVPVNCAALPAGLFESELFGFERGAFTGAINPSKGLARLAAGGTLFLDEVGDLDLSLQVKLLRLIDQGEVRSVGGTRVEKVDVRVIAATNVDLFEAVREGRFRLDLLERLCVLTLKVPSLRERPEDIPLIFRSIVNELQFVAREECASALLNYEWPGNVRELRNLTIRAGVLGERRITAELLRQCIDEARVGSISLKAPENKTFSQGTLEDIEKEIIIERLKRCHGNRKRTAIDLGIAKSTLHEKLRKWQLDEEGTAVWPVARVIPAVKRVDTPLAVDGLGRF